MELRHDLERVMKRENQYLNEAECFREALIDIRNRILCPVGPQPTLDKIQEIASKALSTHPDKGGE